MNKQMIVCAWVDARQDAPRFKPTHESKAVVWLLEGDEEDVKKALSHVNANYPNPGIKPEVWTGRTPFRYHGESHEAHMEACAYSANIPTIH